MKKNTTTQKIKETRIENLDRNFRAGTGTLAGMDIYDVDTAPMELTGLPWRKRNGEFRRFPTGMDMKFSPQVEFLSWCTTGVALRFRTDATEIRIHAEVFGGKMCHMTLVGSRGFDLYVGNGLKQVFAKCATFKYDQDEYTSTVFSSPNKIMRDFTIHFPLYGGVKKFELGLTAGAKVEAPTPWRDSRPIILYGTSITQGGCVSRPGMLYSNILSRLLGQPIYNFGFSGSGKGEPEVARKLVEIKKPAMFILDYDDNALPDLLEKTLPGFIDIIREKYPTIPILCISTEPKSTEAFEPFDAEYASKERPRYTEIHRAEDERRRKAGDDNIYWIDGRMLYGTDFDECTVDGAHANDLGSYRIAHNLQPVIERILNRWW